MNYDRVILELIDRVAALEDEVAKLKKAEEDEDGLPDLHAAAKIVNGAHYSQSLSRKDTTRYLFRGHIYGKNRLVLAVIQEYVRERPNISANELLSAFDRRVQGSLGVVRRLEELRRTYPDYQRRFFASLDEIIHTASDDCVVCSQWGKFNIDNFIALAGQLGFKIESV